MSFWLVLLATFLMWTMWICAFMHQMYPLARATVPKPVYKVKCFNHSMCLNVTEDVCNNTLFDYTWNSGNHSCVWNGWPKN
jgi:ATP synthase subunit H